MAKSKGIDLSRFKHVSSDKNSTRLRHEDGHFLVIAHKGVKGDLKAHLEALSADSKPKEKPMTNEIADQAKDSQDRQGYDEGGKVHSPNEVYGAPHVDAQIERDKHPEATQQDMTSPDPTKDVRTDEQKQRAKEAAATYGYAQGGPVDSVVPNYHDPMTSQAVPKDVIAATSNQVPPDVQQTREIYNRLASNINPKGMVAPVTATQFGPEGQAPAIFRPELALQAQIEQSEQKADNAAGVAQEQQNIIQQNQARTAMGLDPLPVPNVPNGPQVPGSMANPSDMAPNSLNAAVPQAPDTMAQGMGDMAGMLQQGYNKQLAGINQGAEAAGKLGEEQAKLLNDNIKAQTDAKATYQQQYDALEQERQAHMADIQAGHIDPEQYWTGDKSGNGSHSKIASAIGMILAGFNPTNRPNAAVDMLKYQMDRNLDAQKQNLNAKQNLLTANLRQFGNLKDATDMTKLMQADIMQNELKTAAAKAASPMAKAAALQAAGKLQMDYAPLQQQMAMRQTMMKLANGDNSGDPSNTRAAEQMIAYARMSNPEMAKEMSERLVPGVGMATIPVPAAAREQLIAKQQFGKALSDYRQWASQHSGSLSPTDINTGKTMAANVQNLYRAGINGGVFKQGEQNFINGIIDSDPTKFFNSIRVLPKLDESLRENENSLNILKKSHGLPVKQATQASQPQIKIVNGVKYMRGPNGEAVKVK